jgi:cytochrome d ubiquinol oxidase subunit I
MDLDPVLLSRMQWGWVIGWHILLPAFTVGLASYIAVLEAFYFFTGREIWFRISGFWTRIFAVFSGWVLSPALSCRFNSARTGAASLTPPPM